MNIIKTEIRNIVKLQIEGRLDATSSPQLQEEMLSVLEIAEELHLDFTNLDYISSAGLRVLLIGEKAASGKGKQMKLFGVSAEVMEIMNMTGFADILNIES